MLFSPHDLEAIEELYQRVDCPHEDAVDATTSDSKKYILSDHNRDGDSYRSPWSNFYFPSTPNDNNDNDNAASSSSSFKPSRQLRALEQQANEVFDSYRSLYYGNDDNSTSSVYLWNKEGGSVNAGFAGCFLIKKNVHGDVTKDATGGRSQSGYWNSIHVVDVTTLSGGKAKYELSTTVLLVADLVSTMPNEEGTNKNTSPLSATNKVDIGGSLNKHTDKILPCPTESSHITNIGQMIEDAEIDLRSKMDALYIQKTREILDGIRQDVGEKKKHGLLAAMAVGGQQSDMQAALAAKFKMNS